MNKREEIDFNVNDYAEVVLTQLGADILNERVAYYKNLIPNYSEKNYIAGETYKASLWSIMQDFGTHMQLGSKVPFSTTIKLIKNF